MRIISTENRDELRALAFGMTPSEYLDRVWLERDKAYTGETVSKGGWPYKPASAVPSNVLPMKGKRK